MRKPDKVTGHLWPQEEECANDDGVPSFAPDDVFELRQIEMEAFKKTPLYKQAVQAALSGDPIVINLDFDLDRHDVHDRGTHRADTSMLGLNFNPHHKLNVKNINEFARLTRSLSALNPAALRDAHISYHEQKAVTLDEFYWGDNKGKRADFYLSNLDRLKVIAQHIAAKENTPGARREFGNDYEPGIYSCEDEGYLIGSARMISVNLTQNALKKKRTPRYLQMPGCSQAIKGVPGDEDTWYHLLHYFIFPQEKRLEPLAHIMRDEFMSKTPMTAIMRPAMHIEELDKIEEARAGGTKRMLVMEWYLACQGQYIPGPNAEEVAVPKYPKQRGLNFKGLERKIGRFSKTPKPEPSKRPTSIASDAFLPFM